MLRSNNMAVKMQDDKRVRTGSSPGGPLRLFRAAHFSGKDLARFRRALLGWYDRNRRDLPWRRTRDPYAIWLSEIMLQQTRVAAVLDYYRTFLERFPDLAALAAAPEDAVLAAWSGLGYYRRARMLHQCAREIVIEMAAASPKTPRHCGNCLGLAVTRRRQSPASPLQSQSRWWMVTWSACCKGLLARI